MSALFLLPVQDEIHLPASRGVFLPAPPQARHNPASGIFDKISSSEIINMLHNSKKRPAAAGRFLLLKMEF